VVAVPFLDLPGRSDKPRRTGLTHVLDKGLPAADLAPVLTSCGAYVDLWKFGWGTAYVDPGIESKLAGLEKVGVQACTGGTLLEVAWRQGRVDAFLAWAEGLGFPCVEVSRGAVVMSLADKEQLIRRASARFVVVSEVGSKHPSARALPEQWVEEVERDLAAGATRVLAEGRESGTVGIFDADGTVREDLVNAVAAAAGAERVVFEAPRKDQQAWFIHRFGSEVNLANIPAGEVLGVEALRLGLRADTIDLSRPSPALKPIDGG
jgi:phosphosulfolactate synthase